LRRALRSGGWGKHFDTAQGLTAAHHRSGELAAERLVYHWSEKRY